MKFNVMKNKIFKRLIKEELEKIILYGIVRKSFDIVYPLNDTGYMISKHIDLPSDLLLNHFYNSLMTGELYDSEFNAFWNTYIVEQ